MFMPSSGSLKPESSVKACRLFQIVDTPESSETPLNTLRCATPHKTNRTVVIMSPYFHVPLFRKSSPFHLRVIANAVSYDSEGPRGQVFAEGD